LFSTDFELIKIKKGNLVPDYSILNPKTPRDTEAAIELACNFNLINSIIVCGHSDCKV